MRTLYIIVGVVVGLVAAVSADVAHSVYRYQRGMFYE